MTETIKADESVSASTGMGKPAFLGAGMLLPFILVTTLFALWGFANDITNPLVRVFKEVFQISNTQSSLVQGAFYFGYFTMALPAALLIQKFSYKSGILIGLGLYALGAFLTLPAANMMNFWFFILSFYILTFGLAFLETTANPYILSMGPPETATRRLNLAQAFNPVGSLTGMFIATSYIMGQIEVFKLEDSAELAMSDPAAFQLLQLADLATVRTPYLAVGAIVLVVFLIFAFSKMPDTKKTNTVNLGPTVRRLLANRNYREGVIAQAFYVGAQIMCWTYIIHYGIDTLGLDPAVAAGYNIVAMVVFLTSRFISTFLMGYVQPSRLLVVFSIGAMVFTLGAIFLSGMIGLYSLIGISACMSLMFPTIYGLALHGLGEDARIGSAGLIMAIVGGALMPILQGMMIDGGSFIGNIHAVKTSFFLPFVCFIVVAIYGYRASRPTSIDPELVSEAGIYH
ncbi:MAG: L-fucose:H+ symporter permease [Litorimonas sp.]